MRHLKFLRLHVLPLIFLLSACNQNGKTLALESQLNDTNTKLEALKSEVSELKTQASLNQMFKDWEGVAYLTPGANGYNVVKTDLGSLTVSLENVQPYASGSKVTLRFGNLTSGSIDGLKAKFEWGSLDKKGTPINENVKSREVTFNETLLPGNWTHTNVVLEGIPPTELGFVRVRDVGRRGIRLSGR